MRPLHLGDLAVSGPGLVQDGRCPEPLSAYDRNETPTVVVDGLPEGTVELALICHDPDAPRPHGFTHWAVYGVPAREGVEIGPATLDGLRVGPNSRGDRAWMGPRPPAGHGLHRYYFWAYALTCHVEGEPTREEFLDRYGEDVIEQARLVVTYERAPEA